MRREFEAAALRRRDQNARDLTHAWHVANYGSAAFVGKLPSLRSVLSGVSEPRRAMARGDIESAMKSIGIPGRPVSEAAMKAFMRPQES